MLNKLKKPNNLDKQIDKFKSSKSFKIMSKDDFSDFPRLSYEDIRDHITFGFYQLNQGLSYLAEHFDINGDYQIFTNDEYSKENSAKLITSKLQSRHSNNKMYNIYIKYDPTDEPVDSIQEWLCTCKNGKRTVGCCSHIASIIYYLSFGRYNKLTSPASILDSIIINRRIESDNEEDDEDYDCSEPADIETKTKSESNLKKNTKTKNKESKANQLESRDLSNMLEKKLSIEENDEKTCDDEEELLNTYLPSWGGVIESNDEYKHQTIEHTCTIDYFCFRYGIQQRFHLI